MADLAFVAERRFVRVLLVMAGVALGRGMRKMLRIGVAVGALDLRMSEKKREMRLRVIEAGFLPAAFVVAVIASGAEGAFVLVVLAVAGDAFARGVRQVLRIGVAFDAFHLGMLERQRKLGLRVIEARLLPVVLVVAALALGP